MSVAKEFNATRNSETKSSRDTLNPDCADVRASAQSFLMESRSMSNRKPESTIGEVRGRLTIIEIMEKIKGEPRRCRVLCACGTEKVVLLCHFRSGNTTSCGCLRTEKVSTNGGLSIHPLYGTWKTMVARCTNENAPNYPYYGGRGIKVCDRWLKSFAKFIEDMGPRPDGHQIDRIDNAGNYEPSNCKWSTPRENVSNRRNTVLLKANGRVETQSEWARILGAARSTITWRLAKGQDFQEIHDHYVKRSAVNV